MKFYGVTAIIFLFGIIACNASSKCRCGHLGDGISACDNSDKSDGKSRGIVIKGFNHVASNRYQKPAAIRAAAAARKTAKKVERTTSLASGSSEKHRLGGFGDCKSSSSSFPAPHSVMDNDEYLRAIKEINQLSNGERIVPK